MRSIRCLFLVMFFGAPLFGAEDGEPVWFYKDLDNNTLMIQGGGEAERSFFIGNLSKDKKLYEVQTRLTGYHPGEGTTFEYYETRDPDAEGGNLTFSIDSVDHVNLGNLAMGSRTFARLSGPEEQDLARRLDKDIKVVDLKLELVPTYLFAYQSEKTKKDIYLLFLVEQNGKEQAHHCYLGTRGKFIETEATYEDQPETQIFKSEITLRNNKWLIDYDRTSQDPFIVVNGENKPLRPILKMDTSALQRKGFPGEKLAVNATVLSRMTYDEFSQDMALNYRINTMFKGMYSEKTLEVFSSVFQMNPDQIKSAFRSFVSAYSGVELKRGSEMVVKRGFKKGYKNYLNFPFAQNAIVQFQKLNSLLQKKKKLLSPFNTRPPLAEHLNGQLHSATIEAIANSYKFGSFRNYSKKDEMLVDFNVYYEGMMGDLVGKYLGDSYDEISKFARDKNNQKVMEIMQGFQMHLFEKLLTQ